MAADAYVSLSNPIDDFLSSPGDPLSPTSLLEVFFLEHSGEFELRAQNGASDSRIAVSIENLGYSRVSTVTVVEDVSYVCSGETLPCHLSYWSWQHTFQKISGLQ